MMTKTHSARGGPRSSFAIAQRQKKRSEHRTARKNKESPSVRAAIPTRFRPRGLFGDPQFSAKEERQTNARILDNRCSQHVYDGPTRRNHALDELHLHFSDFITWRHYAYRPQWNRTHFTFTAGVTLINGRSQRERSQSIAEQARRAILSRIRWAKNL